MCDKSEEISIWKWGSYSIFLLILSPTSDTPIAPKKGKKRAASSSTDDSGVGISPMTKRIKGEINSPPSAFSPLHSSTPPSDTTNESENTSPSDNTVSDLPFLPSNLSLSLFRRKKIGQFLLLLLIFQLPLLNDQLPLTIIYFLSWLVHSTVPTPATVLSPSVFRWLNLSSLIIYLLHSSISRLNLLSI